uniref:Uncharacterized protein n=1 Tax=Nicotiana tabacum TaxID=4097 RepID=A0A1S4CLL1_TOBAC
MGVLSHLVVQRQTLGREIQKLANDGIRLDETEEGGIDVYTLAQSSLVAHVKDKQDKDPYLVKLKEVVRNKEITDFTLGNDGALKLNDRLCMPDVDGLRKSIMEEAHSSRYSIHPVKTTDFVEQYAQLYIKEIVQLHDTPDSIISDRGPQFTAHFCYQASIGMAPCETLYGQRCRSPVDWFEPAEVPLIGPEFVCEALEKVQLIRERLKAAQSRQKSYSDKRHRDLEFMVDNKVFLNVSPMKGVM